MNNLFQLHDPFSYFYSNSFLIKFPVRLTKLDFWFQTDIKERAKKICLVPKIYFSYYCSDKLTYCNCSYQRHVVWLNSAYSNVYRHRYYFIHERLSEFQGCNLRTMFDRNDYYVLLSMYDFELEFENQSF